MSAMARTIQDRVEKGVATREIADEIGCSESRIRAVASAHEIKLTGNQLRSVRSIAEDMPPLEAVEYLIGVVEVLQGITGVDSHRDKFGFRLTNLEARCFGALQTAAGRMLPKDHLYSAMYFDVADADSLPSPKIVDVIICKIRAKLPDRIGKIATVWGQGFRFEPAEVDQC